MSSASYVLVTPARNEVRTIEGTIRAVLAQSLPPRQWVIVSDGSDDGTDELVAGYARECPYLTLVRTAGGPERGVAAKVRAIRAGCAAIAAEHRFWGNLDADITFERTYFERLLERFDEFPALGIGGGLVCEFVGDRYCPQRTSLESVAGAVQLFRLACYEEIGGYLPLRSGGEDAAAEIMARMCGWEVRTFPDLRVLHHRRVGLGTSGVARARVRQGRMDRALGYHPLFEVARCAARLFERPYVAGGSLRLFGYLLAMLRREEIALPPEAVAFVRAEQLRRLWRGLTGRGWGAAALTRRPAEREERERLTPCAGSR